MKTRFRNLAIAPVLAALTALMIQTASAQVPGAGSGQGLPIAVDADQAIEWHQEQKAYVARGNAVAKRADEDRKASGRDYYPCSSARLGRMVMSYFGKVVDRCSRASINFISLAGTRTPSG